MQDAQVKKSLQWTRFSDGHLHLQSSYICWGYSMTKSMDTELPFRKGAVRSGSTLLTSVIYLAVVVDCHHSLCLCGDRMKMSPPKKFF